jgi:hypothetical protein
MQLTGIEHGGTKLEVNASRILLILRKYRITRISVGWNPWGRGFNEG